MNTSYKITDWESASQVKNSINPNFEINVSTYYDTNENIVLGHNIQVVDIKRKGDSRVMFAFDVETGLAGHYSLSNEEAIIALNSAGFDLELVEPEEFTISDTVRNTLEGLEKLGYKTIVKVMRPLAKIYVSIDNEDAIKKNPFYTDVRSYKEAWVPKGVISPELINYYDYEFLPLNEPVSIGYILRGE